MRQFVHGGRTEQEGESKKNVKSQCSPFALARGEPRGILSSIDRADGTKGGTGQGHWNRVLHHMSQLTKASGSNRPEGIGTSKEGGG